MRRPRSEWNSPKRSMSTARSHPEGTELLLLSWINDHEASREMWRCDLDKRD
jgi:hypothetical protein